MMAVFNFNKSRSKEDKPENYNGKYTRIDVSSPNKSIFDKLYHHEALTAEGMKVDPNTDFTVINNWFRTNSKCTASNINIYVIKGKAMNTYYHLTGDNAYPDNCNIVCIDWHEANCKNPYKGSWRWFSDVVDNNAKREIAKENHFYDHYYSIYYGNMGIKD